MKNIIITLTGLLSFISYAQVGIGTTAPQEELHVAGSTSTIRIDGLNSTNNANNNGLRSQAVYVDTDGNLLLNAPATSFDIPVNDGNALATTNVATGATGTSVTTQLFVKSFTLTQDALVTVQYSISLAFLDLTGTSFITDGKPKIARNFYRFGDGTVITDATKRGRSSMTYSNHTPLAGNYIPTGFFFNNSTESFLLPAGTHSIHFHGYVFGASGGFAQASDAFSVNFGPSGQDVIKVTVHY